VIAPQTLLTRSDCPDAIAYHRETSPAQILRLAADRLADGARDVYGTGAALNAFERKIAAVLGKDAAVFMPSGTMAQQIALRMVADRRARRAFGAHATNHVVLHERDGFARLHGLEFVAVGSPVALITLDDVRAVCEPIASLLLELPQRELGGELPAWEDLVAISTHARDRGWHLHLDGARLWECGPAYGRPYAQIAALFDTVYVSFYKGIGALAGAMLAGPQAFIDEARIWQRRHGGNLATVFPHAQIAEQAFDERIDRMGDYVQAAARVASAIGLYADVDIRPTLPQTNMFHAFIRGQADAFSARVQRIAREHGIWTIQRLAATALPDRWRWEIACGDATLALTDERLHLALDGLFAAPLA
jgi:threonine aldolase